MSIVCFKHIMVFIKGAALLDKELLHTIDWGKSDIRITDKRMYEINLKKSKDEHREKPFE